MQRYVRRVAHHPTIMAGRSGWNIKKRTGAEFLDGAVFLSGSGAAGEHHADMLHVAAGGAHRRPHMDGPFPSRLIGGPADGHAADADEFEFSFFKCAYFIRFFKAFQNGIRASVWLRREAI